uniref:Uncharacterized protein n=1 Tax=Anguilla anguilla TaxID=7936 RepID=A0A0E9QUV9_ANGAN
MLNTKQIIGCVIMNSDWVVHLIKNV